MGKKRCKKGRITERKTSLEVIIYTQADVKFTAIHITCMCKDSGTAFAMSKALYVLTFQIHCHGYWQLTVECGSATSSHIHNHGHLPQHSDSQIWP